MDVRAAIGECSITKGKLTLTVPLAARSDQVNGVLVSQKSGEEKRVRHADLPPGPESVTVDYGAKQLSFEWGTWSECSQPLDVFSQYAYAGHTDNSGHLKQAS